MIHRKNQHTLYLSMFIVFSFTLTDCCCNSKCRTCQVVNNPYACSCIPNPSDPSYASCSALANGDYWDADDCICRCKTGWTGTACDQPVGSITCDATVIDIDGNVYDVIKIGNQCWMKQNLKTTKYNDGNAIPTGLDDNTWYTTTTGACAIYNDSSQYTSQGRFYNYAAVATGKLCPNGWHIPTETEFNTLVAAVGGENNGTAVKATTTWPTADAATNTTGFTALATGFRLLNGPYYGKGSTAYFWSSTIGTDSQPAALLLTDDNGNLIAVEGRPENNGFTCRCVKD